MKKILMVLFLSFLATPAFAFNFDFGFGFNKTLPRLGPELIVNGDFSSATGWTFSTGWSAAGGVGVADGAAAFAGATQSKCAVGSVYEISYDVVTVTAGGVRGYGGNTSGTATRTTPGHYVDTITPSANTFCGVKAYSAGFTGTIDNVSARKLLR